MQFPLSDKNIQKMLLENAVLKKDYLVEAVKKAKEQKVSLAEYLLDEGVIKEEKLYALISEELSIDYVDLRDIIIDKDVMKLVGENFCRQRSLVLFAQEGVYLDVAMLDPMDIEARDVLQKTLGYKVRPYLCSPGGLNYALSKFREDLSEEFKNLLEGSVQVEHIDKEDGDSSTQEEVPAIELVNQILRHAYRKGASDVHIEPHGDSLIIRNRVDGMLRDVMKLPINVHSFLLTRIKVLAKLRTDIHYTPQDGRFKLTIDNEEFSLRVSIVPIYSGEKVVMRLLSEKGRKFSINDLGLLEPAFSILKKAYNSPHGMILVTGPTGSGKTTTLYSILKELNQPEVNISTIEDPIEYSLARTNQIQVNPVTDLTFSSGLRALLRQDPDVIMVGEIRDPETASIGINAALTGHLVLSTLHTNNSAICLPRLLEMGVEGYLVASTVRVVVAQRLVRRLCERCYKSKVLKGEDLERMLSMFNEKLISKYFLENSCPESVKMDGEKIVEVTLKEAVGCDHCLKYGYQGRIGIYEVLDVSKNQKELINRQASADEIYQQAISDGMRTMRNDGFLKALLGHTSVEEVLRVTSL